MAIPPKKKAFDISEVALGILVGLVAGVVWALSLGDIAMVGASVGTGLTAGICSMLSAAQEKGLITADQADEVIAVAAQQLGGLTEAETRETAGSAAACDDVMQSLRDAARSSAALHNINTLDVSIGLEAPVTPSCQSAQKAMTSYTLWYR